MGEKQVTEWEKLPGASTGLVSCLGLLGAVMEAPLTELIWRWWVICPRSCVTLQAFEPRQLSIRMQVSKHCTNVPSGTWIPIYSLESRFFAMIALKQCAWHVSCFGVCSCAAHILWGQFGIRNIPSCWQWPCSRMSHSTIFTARKTLKTLPPSPFQRDHCKPNSQQNLRPNPPPLHNELLPERRGRKTH